MTHARTWAAVAALLLLPPLPMTACSKSPTPAAEPEPEPNVPPGPAVAAVDRRRLTNPSFEAAEAAIGDAPEGWRTEVGAGRTDGRGAASAVGVERTAGADADAALKLSGDAATARWLAVWQDVAGALPTEGELVLSFRARAQGIVQGRGQYPNANGLIAFYDGADKRLTLATTQVIKGDQGWLTLTLVAPIPAAAKRAAVGFLLSMTGTLWIDAVEVRTRALAAWSTEAAGEAWDHLVARMAASYPFEPVSAGEAWREQATKARATAVAAPDRASFVAALVDVLRPLNNLHVAVLVDGDAQATAPPREPPKTWSFDALKARVVEKLHSEREFAVARLESGHGYALIGSWQRGPEPIGRVLKALDRLADAPGLIIDVRANTGGAEALAAQVAQRFAAARVVYAKHRYRLGDGWGPWHERALAAADAPDRRPVVVLQSAWCIDSNEGFLQMMRALPTVTTMGTRSRGASTNPAPVRLTSDITVDVSRWQNALPDGTLTEGAGVPPQIAVDAPASAYGATDPMLDRAIQHLSATR